MSSEYFPPYIVGKSRNFKVALNLSGYARQSDMNYLKGKDLTEEHYLVYIPMNRYLTKITNTENISSWESMGIASDLIKPLKTTLDSQLLYPYSHGIQAHFKDGYLVNENKSDSGKTRVKRAYCLSLRQYFPRLSRKIKKLSVWIKKCD